MRVPLSGLGEGPLDISLGDRAHVYARAVTMSYTIRWTRPPDATEVRRRAALLTVSGTTGMGDEQRS
jgi:hypothetical protein